MWSDAGKRYRTPIADIFSAEHKLKIQLKVEVALAKTQAELGMITEEEAVTITKASDLVLVSRVEEIEAEIHHDLMAVVRALAEQAGDAGEKVHLGATSNDIQDTTLSLQLMSAKEMILDKMDEVSESLVNLARTYKSEACIGRTHGQFAVPTTVGFKFANFVYELHLAKSKLYQADVNISKFSGAIGNYASSMRDDVEEKLLNSLGLRPTLISTQVVSRVVHADFMNGLALCASVLERISKEIRNLQRSEINEWREPFSKKQVGSSAMPHKRNPHKSERISGLSRIIRQNVAVALENIALEHERDISHSSVERIIIPESLNLLYFIGEQMRKILTNLDVNIAGIQNNLRLASGKSKSEQILRLLVSKVGRQEGHELLRSHVNAIDYQDAVLNDPKITSLIPVEELKKIFDSVETGLAEKKVDLILSSFDNSMKEYRD